jgi:hypothetical protein
MSITLNTLAYSQDVSINSNKMLYVGPDNTFTTKDQLTLGRTNPKPTTTFAGVARAEAKRTKTVELADGSFAEAIITVSSSLPVGMAKADADALRDDVGDFAISADCETLFWNHDLTY